MPRPEFDDDSLFGAEERKDRLARAAEQGKVLDAIESKLVEGYARSRERLAEWTRKRAAEDYRRAGLAVPDGPVLVSLAVQLSMGCTIETVDGEKVLVRPNRKKLVKGDDGIWA